MTANKVTKGRTVAPPWIKANWQRWGGFWGENMLPTQQAKVIFHLQKEESIQNNQQRRKNFPSKKPTKLSQFSIKVWTDFSMCRLFIALCNSETSWSRSLACFLLYVPLQMRPFIKSQCLLKPGVADFYPPSPLSPQMPDWSDHAVSPNWEKSLVLSFTALTVLGLAHQHCQLADTFFFFPP